MFLSLGDQTESENCWNEDNGRQPQNIKSWISHWLDLSQILNLRLGDQPESKYCLK